MNFGEKFPPPNPLIWDFQILKDNRSEIQNPEFLKTNIFIVNLAISDLCMLSTQGLPCVIYAFDSDHWIYGPLQLLEGGTKLN